jgi:hypothetical protein
MATETLVTAAFMPHLLSIYNEDANFTHVPERTLSTGATAKILDLYARLCGLEVPLRDPHFGARIERVIEAFRRQWVRVCPGIGPVEERTLAHLLAEDPSSKHLMCVALCITTYRVTHFSPPH